MFVIQGKYESNPWEDIDSFPDKKTAESMLAEYRLAYGSGWQLKIV
jgi:hypothetical protein